MNLEHFVFVGVGVGVGGVDTTSDTGTQSAVSPVEARRTHFNGYAVGGFTLLLLLVQAYPAYPFLLTPPPGNSNVSLDTSCEHGNSKNCSRRPSKMLILGVI